MKNNFLQGGFRTLLSTMLPRISFDCAHILQHQQQKTTDRHRIETIGHIDSQSIDCHYGSLRSWRIWATLCSVQSINQMFNQFLTAEELDLISIEEINAELSWVYTQEPTDKIKAYGRLCFDILGPKVFAVEKMDRTNKHVIIEQNKHFLYDYRAGNRYFLNEEQRQILIEETCEQCEGSGWSPEEIEKERKDMNSWDNKFLVEELCGSTWLGFKGQTTEMV